MHVGIELTDTGETATAVLGHGKDVLERLQGHSVRVTMTRDVLEKTVVREVDAFALAGRSSLKEKRLINFDSVDSKRAGEVMETIKGPATYSPTP